MVPSITGPLAFAAGLLSFVSPCVLPLAPVYLGYLSGSSLSGDTAPSRRLVFGHGVLFVGGFTLILIILLLFGLNAAPTKAEGDDGVIEGELINGTAGGSSVSDQTVMLRVYDEQQQINEQTTETGADGAFHFDGLATGPGFYYRLIVTYQGVSYQSQVGQILQPDEPLVLDITVYEATEDDIAISVEQSHMLVAFSPGAVVIHEMMVFHNASDRSYVGSEPASGGMGGKATLHFPLPPGARDLKPQEGLMACCVVDTDDGFVYTMPVLPGTQRVVFSYRIPYQGSSLTLDRSLVYSVAELNVLMPKSEIAMTSDDLNDVGLVTGGDGRDYRRLTGSTLSDGVEITVRFENIPVSDSPAPAPQPVVALPPFFSYGLLAGGAAMLLTSAILLWYRRASDNKELDSTFDLDDDVPRGDLWLN